MDTSALKTATCAQKVAGLFENYIASNHPDKLVDLILYKVAVENGENARQFGNALDEIEKSAASIKESVSAPLTPVEEKKKTREDKIRAIIEECIPCLERITDLGQLTLDKRYGAELEKNLKFLFDDYERLRDLFDSGRLRLTRDICQIIKFSNENCLPDLRMLKALLLLVYSRLTMNISDLLSMDLSMLVRSFFTPYANIFNSQINQLTNLILGPIECIRASLTVELGKLAVLDPRRVRRVMDEVNDASRESSAAYRADIKKVTSLYSNGIGLLAKWISKGTGQIKWGQEKALKWLNEVTKIHIGSSDAKLQLAQAIMELSYLIGLINMYENFLKQLEKKDRLCDNQSKIKEAVDNFVRTKKADLRELANITSIEIEPSGRIIAKNKPLLRTLTAKEKDLGSFLYGSNEEIGSEVPGLQTNSEVELSCFEANNLDSQNLDTWLARIRSY